MLLIQPLKKKGSPLRPWKGHLAFCHSLRESLFHHHRRFFSAWKGGQRRQPSLITLLIFHLHPPLSVSIHLFHLWWLHQHGMLLYLYPKKLYDILESDALPITPWSLVTPGGDALTPERLELPTLRWIQKIFRTHLKKSQLNIIIPTMIIDTFPGENHSTSTLHRRPCIWNGMFIINPIWYDPLHIEHGASLGVAD